MCKYCDGSVVVHVRIDAPHNSVPNNPPMGPLGDLLLSRAVLVLQLGAQDLDTFHHGTVEMVMCPLRGLVLVPVLWK